MATKPKTQIMSHDDTVMSPITKASNVLFEDGKTAQDKLEDNVEKSFTPSVENSSSMFKVGQGDNVDYSGNVVDGAYDSCVLKGRTLVNCIQEPSSQDVVLPYEFTEGQYVTINDTKESGALGVELKGQTLVNLSGHDRVKGISHAVYQDGIYKYVQDVNNFYDSLALSEDTMKMFSANKTYTFITDSKVLLSKVDGYDNPSRQNGIIIQFEDGTYQTPLTPMQNVGERVEHKIKFTIQNKPIKQVSIRAFTSSLPTKGTFNGEIYKMVLVEGDYTNQEIPYFEGMTSIKAPIVKTVGKNLVNLDNAVLNSNHQKVVTKIENGFNIKFAYNPNNYSSWDNAIRLRVDVKPNTNYVLSLTKVTRKDPYQGVTPLPLWVSGYTWVRQGGSHHDSLTEGNLTNGTPTVMKFNSGNYNYVTLDVCSTPSRPAQDGDFDIVDIQLEEDTQATIYEPHKSSSLTLPNEVVLRSLPNGVCDTFNTRTGDYVQRIGEKTLEELSRIVSFSSIAWSNLSSHGAYQLVNIVNHINVNCNAHGQNMWSDNYAWAASYHGGSYDNPNDNLPNVFLAFSNDGHLRLMVRKTLIKPDSPQDVTANDIMDWGRQNVILSTRIQYQLKTPIITKVDPKSVLKPHNTKTHIYTEIPQNSLYPILSHSNPTYPVILKPSTKYSIVANSYSNNHTNSPINFNLGGATASTTVGNRVTTVTTPSALSNELLTMSGKGNKLNNVMVIEGDVVGDEPYFEGICDVKSPVVKNVGKNLFDLNGEWVKCTYSYGVPQAAPYTPTITISNNGFSITSHINSYNSGFGQYVDVSSLDILYVRATAIYTDTKTVPELKIIGLYENESIPSSVNSTNSSDFKVITKQLGSEQEVSFDLDVSSYSKIFIMFSGGWKSGMSGSYTFTMKDVYIGSSNQTYEPYKSNTTTFNQKDGKTIVLRSLPNGICDTLNVETGEYVRRIGEKTLNGEENGWYAWVGVENDSYKAFALGGWVTDSKEGNHTVIGNKLSNQFIEAPSTSQKGEWFMTYRGMNAIWIAFNIAKSKLVDTTVASFISYLKQKTITVQYELATPIISTIDVQGFPHAYKDGHVQLSSGYNGQSLTPKIEYSLPINRNGQIRMNQAMVERHQKHIDKLQAIIITNMVNTQYRQSLTKINYQLGGEQV